jgi:hypothetical protein
MGFAYGAKLYQLEKEKAYVLVAPRKKTGNTEKDMQNARNNIHPNLSENAH